MAALPREFAFLGMHISIGKPRPLGDSPKARAFANRVYNETQGPTPELKRLYAKLVENEQRTAR